MSLEYILVYDDAGRPLYSNCIAGFCETLSKEPKMLDDMLIKLSKVPRMISKGEEKINKYSLDNVDFHFFHDQGIYLVFGMTSGEDQIDQSILDRTATKLLDNLGTAASGNNTDKVDQLMNDLITHTLHQFIPDGKCPAGDRCPLKVTEPSKPIWEEIADKYNT